jgi:hypothetical protein
MAKLLLIGKDNNGSLIFECINGNDDFHVSEIYKLTRDDRNNGEPMIQTNFAEEDYTLHNVNTHKETSIQIVDAPQSCIGKKTEFDNTYKNKECTITVKKITPVPPPPVTVTGGKKSKKPKSTRRKSSRRKLTRRKIIRRKSTRRH